MGGTTKSTKRSECLGGRGCVAKKLDGLLGAAKGGERGFMGVSQITKEHDPQRRRKKPR